MPHGFFIVHALVFFLDSGLLKGAEGRAFEGVRAAYFYNVLSRLASNYSPGQHVSNYSPGQQLCCRAHRAPRARRSRRRLWSFVGLFELPSAQWLPARMDHSPRASAGGDHVTAILPISVRLYRTPSCTTNMCNMSHMYMYMCMDMYMSHVHVHVHAHVHVHVHVHVM